MFGLPLYNCLMTVGMACVRNVLFATVHLSDDCWYGMCLECFALPLYHCLTIVGRCCSITFVRAVESVPFFYLLSLHSSCLECSDLPVKETDLVSRLPIFKDHFLLLLSTSIKKGFTVLYQ